MSKITINVPLEGAKTATTDLTDADSAWISASGNVDGTNIREEGLDRRVIKSTAWTTETGSGGMDNFHSSGRSELQYTGTTTTVFYNVPAFDSGTGGVSGRNPIIKKYWKASKTAGILVRCSFVLKWDTLSMQTWNTTGVADKTNAQIQLALFRSLPGGTMAGVTGFLPPHTMVATQSLSKAFGSRYASGIGSPYDVTASLDGTMLDISNPYDRRSNLYSSITLVDAFLPFDDGSDVDGDVYWRPRYRMVSTDFSTEFDKTFPEVHDINFAAHKFVR